MAKNGNDRWLKSPETSRRQILELCGSPVDPMSRHTRRTGRRQVATCSVATLHVPDVMLSESLAGQSTSCGQRKRIRLNSLHLFLIFRCADISRFLRWNQRNDLTSEIFSETLHKGLDRDFPFRQLLGECPSWMQHVPEGAVLRRAPPAWILVAKAIDDNVPDWLELLDHHVFTKRYPDVIDDKRAIVKIAEI